MDNANPDTTIAEKAATPDLLPCPFCGGSAKLIAGWPGWIFAGCENCNASADFAEEGGAIAAWNRRALPAARAEVSVAEAARVLLEAYDDPITPEQKLLAERVVIAAPYASTAFKMALDDGQGTHAMARSFLQALVDPTHEDLDYLRADPAAGQAERERRALAEGGET